MAAAIYWIILFLNGASRRFTPGVLRTVWLIGRAEVKTAIHHVVEEIETTIGHRLADGGLFHNCLFRNRRPFCSQCKSKGGRNDTAMN